MLTTCASRAAGRPGGPLHYFVLKEMPPSSALAFLNFTTTKSTPSVFLIAKERSGGICEGDLSPPPAWERQEATSGQGTHGDTGLACSQDTLRHQRRQPCWAREDSFRDGSPSPFVGDVSFGALVQGPARWGFKF